MARRRSPGGETPQGEGGSSTRASPGQPNLNLIDEQDRQVVTEALRKRGRGEKLTQREQQAVRRLQRRQDEANRERLYSTMPKGDYVRLSGRAHRVLQDQAERYGLPLLGSTINLGDVLTRFHDLIAQTRGRFGAGDEEIDPLLEGVPSDAQERYRLAKAKIEEHKLAQIIGRLIDRDEMLRSLAPIFDRLRTVGETLQREFGPGAHRLLDDALIEFASDLEHLFDRDSSSSSQPNPTPAPGPNPASPCPPRPDDA